MPLRIQPLSAILAAALSVSAAHVQAADPASKPRTDECVFTSTLDDYHPVDAEHLIVWAPGRRQPYLVTLMLPSSGLKWGIRLGFDDRDNNGMICGFGPDAVIIPDGIPDRVPIKGMEKITPERAEQLLAGSRKKPGKEPSPQSRQ